MSHDLGRRQAVAAAGTSLFLALAPGTVAVLVPYLLTRWDGGDPSWWWPVRLPGLVVLSIGAVVLLSAFARFVVEGIGTPAPAAPTEQLVVGGLYRYVRNPMYVAVAAVILGQAVWLGRPVLVIYGTLITLLNVAFVRWYEEPALRRRFGADYDSYRESVPGWIPRFHPPNV